MKKLFLFIFSILFISSNLLAQDDTSCDWANNPAEDLTVGTSCSYTNGDISNMNTDSGEGDPGCGSYGSGPDVWYSFTVPASGNFLIQTQAGSLTDLAMAVYSGSCGSLSEITCDDDGGPGTMPEIIVIGATAGETIWIRLWDYGGGDYGDFDICVVDVPPPANDDCSNAESLTVNPDENCATTTSGTILAATASGDATSCSGTPNNDVWYTFTADYDEQNISLLNVSGSTTDMYFSVYSGSCGALTELICSDPNSSWVSGLTVGDTYYVRVYSYGSTDVNTTFDVCVTSPSCTDGILNQDEERIDCGGVCPVCPPPTEQDCEGAIPICQDTYSTTTSYSGTGNITGEIDGAQSCLGAGEKNDVWYTFTAMTTGNLGFNITPVDGGNDYDWSVFDLSNNDCADIYTDASLEVSCDFSPSTTNNGITGPNDGSEDQDEPMFTVTAGNTYVINVSNYSSSQDGYTIDFGISSASIYDDVPPVFESVDLPLPCGATELTFHFNENVACSSVETADFYLNGPGGPYTISSIYSAVCNAGGDYDDDYTITVSPALTTSGTFTIGLDASASGSVTDICGNTAASNSFDFDIINITSTQSHTDVNCNGGNNGNATISLVVEGTADYTYTWSEGTTNGPTSSTTNSISTLHAGTYVVTVTDALGCESVETIVVSEPPAIDLSSNDTDESCDGANDGAIDLTVSGGTPGYTYSWTGGASTQDISNLTDGTYTVTVTDSHSCPQTYTTTINAGVPVVAVIDNETNQCLNGNSFTFGGNSTPAGGTYSWDFGDGSTSTQATPTHSYATDGTYTVSLTYTNGACSDNTSINVTVYPHPTAGASVDNQVTCNGYDDGQATATGGGTYAWSSGGTSATESGLAPGTYTVTVTSSTGGCTDVASVTIIEPDELQISTAVSATQCNGSTDGVAQCNIDQTSTSPYDYAWSSGQTTNNTTSLTDQITGGAATYTVTVTDDNGCTAISNATISEPTALVVTSTYVDGTCDLDNGSIDLTVSDATSPYTYTWTGPSGYTASTQDIFSLAVGTYNYTVEDANGCSYNNSVTISNLGNPAIAINTYNDPTCNSVCNGDASVSLTTATVGTYSYSWSNGSTGTTVTGLCDGSYTVTVTDGNSCTATASVTLTEPSALTASVTATDASCNGVCDAQATVTAGGGSGSYDYSWNNSSSSTTATTASDLCGDQTYTVTVADANDASCTITATITPSQPNALSVSEVSASHVDVDCNGNSTGELEVSVTGGSPAYQYSIDGGANWQASATFTGLSANTYTITVEDANHCSETIDITITEPAVLSVSEIVANHQDVTCNGGNNGAFIAQAAGGTTAYQYSIDGGTNWQATGSFSGLTANTYTINVEDANHCTISMTITITEPTPLTATISAVALTCNGACDGQATVTPGGGSGAYTYTWDNTANSTTATTAADLCGGSTYTVTVADANDASCTVTTTVTPTEPAALTASVTATDASCNGVCDAQATVTAGGGSGSYDYTWNNTANSTTATTAADLCGDGTTYTVTVADAADATCTVTATITPVQPAFMTVSEVSASHVDVDCNGNSTGELEVSVTGGTPAYQYSIDGGANWQASATFTGLSANTYTITVEDNNGCQETISITITEPDALTVSEIMANHQDVTCNGGSTGALTAQAADGTGPYQYSIDGGTNWQATGSFSGLSAGTYTIDVIDANSCPTSMTITITEPAVLTATIPAVTLDCNGVCDATATVTPGGGSGSYTYTWDNVTADNTATTTANLCGDGTTYSVTVADANDASCTIVATVTPTEPAAISITTSSNDANCGNADGDVDASSVTGGTSPYTYNWEDNSSNQVGTTASVGSLAAGTYYLTVTDANGCEGTANATINNNAAGTVTIDLITNVNCNGGSDGAIDISATGTAPLTYDWTGPNSYTSSSEDISGLEAGDYTINVTDGAGCVVSANATVTEPTAITAVPSLVQDVSCNGGSDGSVTVTPNGGTVTSGYTFEWFDNGTGATTGQTTQTASGLPAGDYYVVVSDNATPPCTYTSVVVTISEPTLLTASATITSDYNGQNISCNGAFDGAIDLTAANGTPTYTYSWAGPNGFTSSLEDISGLEAGTYDVTVTDANGCPQTVTITLSEPDVLAITTSAVDAHCGQADGEVDVPTVTGGTATYTYNWEDNTPAQVGTTANVTNLAAGTYDITVTDVNGCTAISSATITDLPGPNDIAITVDNDVTVQGACDGQATVTMTGAVSYVWYTDNTYSTELGQTTATATNLCAQEYCVIVTDGNGCTDQACVTIVEPGAISITGVKTDNLCNGDCNGAIDITPSGGIGAPYTYDWENDANAGTSIATTEDVSGLCAGSYTVTVTDGNGAFATYSATITEPTLLTASAAITSDYNGQNISCNGASDGAVDLTVADGTPVYTYNWTGPNGFTSSLEDISGLEAGTYDVTVTDANGCPETVSITLTEPDVLSITTSVVDAHCGQADGEVDVPTVTGGTATYTYNWEDNTPAQVGTTANVTNLAAGTYDITVTDVNGCTAISSATINDLPGPNDIAITVDNDVTVLGACDGQATVTMTGAVSYEWYTDNTYTTQLGQTTATATNLCAQEYCVIVTDGNGCTDQACVTIVEPGAISVTGIETDNLCNGDCNGIIDISPSGGVGAPYTFNWEDDSNPGVSIATTEDLTGLCVGSYSVTVTDANGATGTYSATITEPTLLTASAVVSSDYNGENISCNGASDGAIDLTVTNGTPTYTYNWSGPNGFSSSSEDVSGLEAGTYDVTVTDANGCSQIVSTTLTEPTAIIAINDSIINPNCGQADGSIYISVTGGTVTADYTYSWNTTPAQSTQDAIGIVAGTYDVVVTDDNSCSVTLSGITLTDNPAPIVLASVLTQPLCSGDTNAVAVASIDSPTTGPYDYDWDNGLVDNLGTTDLTDTVSGLNAAITYYVTVTDANGCTATANVKPINPTPVVAVIGSATDVLCNGGNSGNATVAAHGGTVTTDYTYSWNGGASPNSMTDTNLTAGTYFVTVYDDNGCSDTASVTISEPTLLEVSVTSYTDETCNASNGDITISATGGTPTYSYQWDANAGSGITETANGLDGGATYWVTVTDANGCEAVINQYIDTIPVGVATITSIQDISCFGNNDGTATVSVVGTTLPYDYVWSNGYTETNSNSASSIAIGLSQGVISVDITDTNACVISASATINEPAQLANTFILDTLECNAYTDASITTNVTGGTSPNSYAWNDVTFSTDSFLSNIGAGTYTVTITDNNGCSIIDSVTIADPPAMSLSFTSSNSSCNQSDGAIDMTVTNPTAPMSYSWTGPNGFTATTEDVSNIPAGTYDVIVTNGSGCTVSGTATVIDESGPIASIIDSADVVCAGDFNGHATVDATGGTGAGTYTYLWSNGDVTATATNLGGGTYTVSVTDQNGCVATTSVTIYEPDTLDFNLATFDPLCNGGNDGWASVTPFNGTAPYTYQWTGSGTNPNDSLFIDLEDGLYSIQITDANGCDTVLNNIQISEPPFISATSTVVDVLCYGGNNGSITINATGGTVAGDYSYAWDINASSQTTSTASGLSAGSYTVTVSDDNNCTLEYTATIVEPTQLVIDTFIATDLSCYQSADGYVNSYVSGGTPAYTYQWATATNPNYSGLEDIANIDSDTYFLTVTDANGCSVDTSVFVDEPDELIVSLNSIAETCYGYCDGIINSVVSGGTTNYNYLWSDNSTNSNLTNVCPGSYDVTVTDVNGCVVIGSEVIDAAPQLFINVDNVVSTSCGGNNGEITISIGGGNGVPVIDWDAFVNNANSANLNNSHVIDLYAGNYFVQVTDGNGCQIDTTIPVNNIGGPIFDSVSVIDVTCFGDCDGSITVYYHEPTPSASPYTITWQGYPSNINNNILDGLCEGTYYWEVSDANDCIISGSGQVNSPTQVTSAISSITDATCNGICNGNATVNASGGVGPYTYNWSNGDNISTASDLCAGAILVTVTDAHNCTSITSGVVDEPAELNINLDYINDASCYGYDDGLISITAQGGSGAYYYNWLGSSSSTSIADNLNAGNTYTVIVSDQDDINCTISADFTIDEPDQIVIYTDAINTTCNQDNGTAMVTSVTGGTPGYTYLWTPCSGAACTSTTITDLTDGAYQLEVEDANGCTEQTTVNVYDKPAPYILASVSSDVLCNGGNDGCASLTVKAGERPYVYYWAPYGGTHLDSATCNLGVGTYYVTVQDADGCEVTTVFTIDEPDLIEIYADGPLVPVCINQETYLTVNASGGTPQYTYNWSDTTMFSNVTTVYPSGTTTYTVSVTDANGCSSNTAQVTVQVYPAINVTASPEQTICFGETTNISATATGGNGGNYTYNWIPVNSSNNSVVSVSPIGTTTYYVWASDACSSPSDTATTTINIENAPQVLSITGGEGCEPLDVQFGIILADTSLNVSYDWNFGNAGASNSTLPNPTYTYNNEGIYDVSLTLTSINGCKLDTTIEGLAKVYPLPEAVFSSDKQVVSIFNSEVEFTDNSDGYGYPLSNMWDFGDTTAILQGVTRVTHRYEFPGIYNVMLYVENQYGCRDSASTLIQVDQEHTFYMPNAFRPHVDKWFYPKGIGIETGNYKFTIYDRWGEPIFETTEFPAGTDKVDRLGNIEGGWNGRFNNDKKLVQAGVYVWIVEIKDVNGYMHEYSGTVNVIR